MSATSGIWGVNRFHGSLAKDMTSYGVDEGFKGRRDLVKEQTEWEATAAWDAARWKLEREANQLLTSSGVRISRKGDVTVPEGAASNSVSAQTMSDEEFMVFLASVLNMIVNSK